MKNIHGLSLVLLATVLTLAACKKDEAPPTPATPAASGAEVSLEVRYELDGQPYAHNAELTDADGRAIALSTFRFLLSGITLLDADDRPIGNTESTAVLANAADPTAVVLGQVPAGTAYAVRIRFGLDSITNHAISPNMAVPPAPPLNDATMSWSWNTAFGYKFIDIAGNHDADGDGAIAANEGAFTVHAAGDALRTFRFYNGQRTLTAGTPHRLVLRIELRELFRGMSIAGATHSELQGTTIRTRAIMDGLVSGVELLP